MSLIETFEIVHLSIVGFASTIKVEEPGKDPILPSILGTGFVVDSRGVVATNRHVVEAILELPIDPRDGSMQQERL